MPMPGPKEEESTKEVSTLIIAYKLISGILEIFLGFGMMLFDTRIFQLYRNFRTQELIEDPHDIFARLLQTVMPAIIQHRVYIISLLFLFGITKIIGAVGLFLKKEWGLDILVGLFLFLFPFDLYNFIIHPSAAKLIYMVINTFIALYLVQFRPHEYFARWKKYSHNKR